MKGKTTRVFSLFAVCERIVCLLVDSHTHIDTSRFNADREAVIQSAIAGGVTRMIDPGCDLASSRAALSLAQPHPCVVFPDSGVPPPHPPPSPHQTVTP